MGIGELAHLASTEVRSSESIWVGVYPLAKRALDVVVSAIALLVLSPLYLLIAIAIKLDSPGPVIFRQLRVRGSQDISGAHPERNTFSFLKFRSMYTNADPRIHRDFVRQYINGDAIKINNGTHHMPLFKIRHDPRVTRVGCFIRKTSLDELPQLINVLRGEMSLVGPRPALPYEVEQYDAFDRRRLIPQAGLTGLWQVSGRTTLTFKEMIRLDIQYARQRSLWLDFSILLRTVPTILSRKGAW